MRTKKHLVKNIVTFVMAIALVIGMIPVMPGSIKAQAYSESGFLWNGVDGSAFVNTDRDDDSIGSYWYVITDNEDGGKSKVVFNQADPYGDGSTINDEDIYKYSGISGTAILDKGTLGINPFVYICFDIYGKDEKGRPIPVDISNYWAGLSISYMCDCDATLELGLGDATDAQIEYANPYVDLKANANGLVKEFEWKKFGQPGWVRANQIISGEEAVKTLATVKIKIQAPDSSGGTFHFMIDRIGTLGSVPYTVVLEDKGYIITYEGVDGASFENSNPDRYTIKDSFTLNNPSKEGYEFAGWTGTGLDAATTSVTIPEKSTGNRVYTATWTPIDYDITKSAEHGTFTVKKGDTEVTKANYNDTLTLTATPDTGYKFVSWTVKDKDNNDIPVTDNTFTMPAGDVIINAEFGHNYSLSDLDYGIELEVGDTVQNDEAFSLYYGKDDSGQGAWVNSFTITKDGLVFNGQNQYPYTEGSRWFCFKHPTEGNGAEICVWQEDTSIIFRELDPDHLSHDGGLYLSLDDVPYINNLILVQGVTWALSNRKENEQIRYISQMYDYDEKSNLYSFDVISFDESGLVWNPGGIYISDIIEDHENGIKYLYPVRKTYNISKNTPDNGSFDVLFEGRESSEACPGEEVTISINPDFGYELKSISVKCGTTPVEVLKKTDTSYTFTMPEGDVDISAEFKAKGYIVTFKVEDGSWKDGSADDIVILLDLDKHYLTADQIPSVGENPRYHYKEGAWNIEPTTSEYIFENTVFIYTYKYIEEYEIVSDKISELPDAQDVSFSDNKAIDDARKAYNALSEEEKGQISEDLRNKLADVEAAFLALVEASKANPEIVNTWTELKTAMEEGGAIKLGADVTDPKKEEESHLVVGEGNYVVLDLNGHIINRGLTADSNIKKGYVIYISKNATLDLYDNDSQNEGKITGGYSNGEKGGGIYIYFKGTLNMYGGTITGNTSVVNYSGGGGIYNNGTFNMFDGTITGNNAIGEGDGGGIHNNGTFNMYGGIVSGNHASHDGNDVYTYNNNFIMTGGTIEDVDHSNFSTRFVLSFDNNGGTGSMTEQYIMLSSNATPFTWLKECEFEAPSGKKFLGWSFSENGKTVFSEKEMVKVDRDENVESHYVIVKVNDDGTTVGDGIEIEKESTNTLYAVYGDKEHIKPTVSLANWVYGDKASVPEVSGNLGNGEVTYLYKLTNDDSAEFESTVPIAAGEYTVAALIEETKDYFGGEATAEFSIIARPLTITTSSAEKVYDGTALTKDGYKISETGLAGGDKIVEGSIKVTGSQTEAGSSDNTVSGPIIKNGEIDVTANYNIIYNYGILTVTKATGNNVTVAITGWTYGDNANSPTSTADFGANTVAYTYSNTEDGTYTATVPTNAGTYWVKASVAGTDSYPAGAATASFTISKKAVEASAVNIVRNRGYYYTGEQVTVPKEDLTVKIGNDIIDSEEYDISYGENINAGNGTYTIKSNDKCNYTFEKTEEFVINKKALNLKLSLEGWTYGATPNKPVLTGNLSGGKVTYSYARGKYIMSDGPYEGEIYQGLPTDAGDYVLFATVEDTDNYYGDGTHCEFTIKKAPVTVTADDKTIAYGEADPIFTATVTGNPAIIGEVRYDVYRSGSINVGTYTIVVCEPELAPDEDIPNLNFDVKYVNGTLTITKSTTNNVTVDITGWTYGDKASAPTCTADFGADTVVFTYSNAENGTYTATVPTNAGTYWVKASIAGTDNYVAGEAKKSFVIAKKSVSITGLSVSDKTYDGTTAAAITGTATVSGIVGTDDVSVAPGTASFADKNVGTGKAVTLSGFSLTGTAAGNYILSAQPAGTTANITAKAVTVKAEDKTKVYGETDPAKTVTIDGLVDGESESLIAYTISRATGENAGTYTITPAGDATQGNYTVSFETGTLTISQAQSIANAPAATMSVKYAEGSVVYDKVSKVALPDGWAWSADDKDKALEVNTPLQVSAVYEGTDKDNYTDAAKSVTVTITRNACTHEGCETEVKDAKAATCTETGYTGDTYCKTCGGLKSSGSTIKATGHNLTAHTATESTCTATGNSAYWSCDRCDKYFSDADAQHEIVENTWIIAKKDHTYDQEVVDTKFLKSAATCTSPAVYYKSCVCGAVGTDTFEYGTTVAHDYQEVANTAKAPTCTEAGKTADVKCSVCGDVVNGTVINALGHNLTAHAATEATCTATGNSAYWSCDRCNKYFSDADAQHEIVENSWIIAKKDHTYDQEVATAAYLKSAADCTHKAVYYKSCVCGEKSTDTFEYGDVLGHDYQVVPGSAVEATLFEDGKQADLKCSRCEAFIEGAVIPKHAHVEETINAVDPTCTVVGHTEGKKCSICGTILVAPVEIAALGHDYQVVAGSAVAATCTEDGHEANQECSRCHDVKYGTVINATGHNMTAHEANEATLDADGNNAYWSCDKCGKYFADAEGNNEIPEGSWKIAKLTPTPNPEPSQGPSETPTPSQDPSGIPSQGPSNTPTQGPSNTPSQGPSNTPSQGPSDNTPSQGPSNVPSQAPSDAPSNTPTDNTQTVKSKSISVDVTKATLYTTKSGENVVAVKATIGPENVTNNGVIWSLSDKGIVSISSDISNSGEQIKVYALQPGTVTVTATAADNDNVKAVINIEVVEGPAETKTTEIKDETGKVIKTETVKNVNGKAVEKITTENGITTREPLLWVEGLEESYRYTGSDIKPSFSVYCGNILLVEKNDYVIEYENNKVGPATITIKFKGNYSSRNNIPLKFNIVPAVLGEDIIVDDTGVVAKSKNAIKKPTPILYWAETGKTLSETYFNFTYYNSKNEKVDGVSEAGEYTVVVTVKPQYSNYTGEASSKIFVTTDKAKNLSNANVSMTPKSYIYTGEEIIPQDIKISLGKQTLENGTDYEIKDIINNINPGTATIVFEAVEGNKNGYVGTKIVTFTIKKGRDISGNDFRFEYEESVPYAKGGAKPKVLVYDRDKLLTEGVDYTLSWRYNKSVTDKMPAEIIVNGKGNYKGKVTLNFEITKQDISNLSVVVDDYVGSSKKVKKPKLTVTDLDGKELKKSTDFSVGDLNINGNVVTFDITGKGNYNGSVKAEFRCISKEKNIGKAKVKKIADQYFKGYEVCLSDDDLKGILSLDGKDLIPGEDFVVQSYTKNNKKGTAKVTLKGINGYGGTKTLSFKIVLAQVEFAGVCIDGEWVNKTK